MSQKSFKVKTHLGEYPTPLQSEWWTEEDWEKWSRRKEGYIFSGEYMKEEEFEFTMIGASCLTEAPTDGLGNLGLFIPKGSFRDSTGRAVMFTEHKQEFLQYCALYKIDLEPLSLEKIEELYIQWENKRKK